MATEGKKPQTPQLFQEFSHKSTMSSTGGFSKPASRWHLDMNDRAGDMTSNRLFWLQPVCLPTQSFSGRNFGWHGPKMARAKAAPPRLSNPRTNALHYGKCSVLMQSCCLPCPQRALSQLNKQFCLFRLFDKALDPSCMSMR